jgi:hypothetical protein
MNKLTTYVYWKIKANHSIILTFQKFENAGSGSIRFNTPQMLKALSDRCQTAYIKQKKKSKVNEFNL